MVRKHNHKLDKRALKDFLNFTGHAEEEFWQVAEKLYNRDIFEKRNGNWSLKYPIWKEREARA